MMFEKCLCISGGGLRIETREFDHQKERKKTIRINVENDSFDELEPKLSWNKGGPGSRTGGPPGDPPKGRLTG